MMLSSVT